MKNKFLTVMKLFLTLIALSFLTVACENDDFVPEFTLQEASEQVAFVNSFSNEYLLSSDTKNNIAERFVWNQPEFGVQTAVSYSVEGSITEPFDNIVYESGTLSDNNHAVTVDALLTIAQDYLNLDDDPTTEDIGNTGTVYFRVKAFPGSGSGQDAIQTISEVIALNITIIEKEVNVGGIEISTWGVVGSATPNGWDGPDIPFYTTNQNNVIVAYATLTDGQIKFRENNTWGGDYGDVEPDGILDQESDNNIDVSAGTYKITIDWNDNSYTIEEFYWGIVGSATPNGWDGPDVKLSYDYTTDTFKSVVQLIDGQIKFRMNDTWGGDYGDVEPDGVLDQQSDNNINVTAGYYLITVNFNTLEYSIEDTEIWGVVGSATPNGWDGPDTKLVPDFSNPGVWVLKDMTLNDGQIKFRPNDTWSNDYGDVEPDGILDQESDNNIDVTAGTYTITINWNDNSYTIE